MQVLLKTPSGCEPVENRSQQKRLASPFSLLQVSLGDGEKCDIQFDKDSHECEVGLNEFRIVPNRRNQRSVKIRHNGNVSNIQFNFAGANDINEHDVGNLMHFQNSIKRVPCIKANKWSVPSLFDSIEKGEVTLLSVTKPLTGFDNKSLLDKLESALTQKVKSICSSPKQGIRTDELVQDVSMVKRINTNTLTHLSSHTEHWKARTLSGLIPKRLRADIIEDETNIYENLFFKMAIDDIADYTTTQIISLKKARKQNKVAIDWEEYGMQINDYNRSVLLQKLLPGKDTTELSKENKAFNNALHCWMNISKILVSIRSSSFYRKIDRKRHISKSIHLTNILKNDQRYKALYDIWCLVRKELQKEQQEKQDASDDITNVAENYYFTYTTISLLYSMNLLGIVFDANSEISLDEKENLSLYAVAEDTNFRYKISCSKNEYETPILIVEIAEQVNIIYPLNFQWEFDKDKLKEVSNLISFNKKDNSVCLHKKPTSTERTALSDLIHIRQSELRKMDKEAQDNYKNCNNAWNEYLNTLDSDTRLHDPYTRKLTVVPIFSSVSSETIAVEKNTNEIFNTSNGYTCYLMANAMENYREVKKPYVLRRLFNYGEAFYSGDSSAWKDYYVATLPTTQTDIGSIQHLMKYISLHRSLMIMEIEKENPMHCPVCGGTHISQNGSDSWKCNSSDCGIEWGKTRCTKGCHEYFQWIRPEKKFKHTDIERENENLCDFMLRKDSLFDRYVITDFEFEAIDDSSLKAIPVCPKCGTRRND